MGLYFFPVILLSLVRTACVNLVADQDNRHLKVMNATYTTKHTHYLPMCVCVRARVCVGGVIGIQTHEVDGVRRSMNNCTTYLSRCYFRCLFDQREPEATDAIKSILSINRV